MACGPERNGDTMKAKLSQVHLELSGTDEGRASLSATDQHGNRLHIWGRMQAGGFTIPNPTAYQEAGPLYKNCPRTIKTDEPGYFRTRKLRADSHAGKATIEAMLAIMKLEGLEKKARHAWADKVAAEKHAQREAAREYRIQQANPQLYDVFLKASAFTDWLDARGGLYVQEHPTAHDQDG